MKYLFFSIILIFAYSSSCAQGKAVKLEDDVYSFLVDDELEFMETDVSIDFNQILKNNAEFNTQITAPNTLKLNKAYWSRIPVWNTAEKDLTYVIGFETARQADFWELYVLDSLERIVSHHKTGRLIPYKKRNYLFGHHTYLKLVVPKDAYYQLYFKQVQQTNAFVPNKLSYLFIPYETHLTNKARNRLYIGIYIGFIVVMLFYNLFLYFSVNDKAYFYYVLFLLGAFLVSMQLFGLGMESIWANIPIIDIYLNLYLLPLWCAVYLIFVQRFLHAKEYSRKLNMLLNVLKFISFGSLIFAIIGQEWVLNYLYLLVIISLLISLFVGIIVWKRGYKTAAYFLIANLLFIIGVVLFILRAINVLPTTIITTYAIQIGSGLEMVFFSLGLADRINRFQDELFQAKIDKTRLAQESDEEERIMIEKQKRTLEEEILQRTSEVIAQKDKIEDQNKQLADALEMEKLHVEEMEATHTKLMEAYERLKSTQSQLVQSEKMASLGLMTAGIAHEINNPLNFIYAGVDTLDELLNEMLNVFKLYEKLDIVHSDRERVRAILEEIQIIKYNMDYELVKEDVQRMVQEIKLGAERASEIIKGLRLFARGEGSNLQKVDIHELIGTALVLLKNLMKGRVEVITSFDPEIDLLMCHPSQMTQVFMNLIANGAQAIEGEGTIYITTQKLDHAVEIRIQDTGMGIPEQIKNKIFEPFFTTKDIGEGTGLGLSISYGIIQSHNGHVTVNSKLGKGTEFVIKLPIES